jgi:threonine dehydratase
MANSPSSLTNNEASIAGILQAKENLKGVIQPTPLQKNMELSDKYQCNVYLKREDLQIVRSYKIRGAYNFISQIPAEDLKRGVVCSSAGNHAQGVAYSCRLLGVKGTIFMPSTAPKQKVSRVKSLGKENIEIVLVGDTYDDAYAEATQFCQAHNSVFVHPFDEWEIIEGQGTVGVEIVEQSPVKIDYIFMPIGGGGLASGVGLYVKAVSPNTKIIGVEPEGAAGMLRSREAGKVVVLDKIDKFVDGAALKKVGEKNFAICNEVVDEVVTVPEGKVCTTILELYNEDAIVVEPAGALSIAVLDDYKERIKGKNIVCIVSGGNNDIDRMPEIKERSLIYEGLKHYFIINFPQRPGSLREFVNGILGPNDDITRFEYFRKNFRENGPALVCVEFKDKKDYYIFVEKLKEHKLEYTDTNNDLMLFNFII